MKRITTLLTILVTAILVLTACKSKEAEPGQVEVTRIVKETVVVPGEAAAPAAGKRSSSTCKWAANKVIRRHWRARMAPGLQQLPWA